MTTVVAAEAPPLAADAAGVFRVGNTRVTLDTIVGAFCDGATAEEIAEQYPAISLGQVYAIIAYYLAHTVEVNDYLQAREQRAAEVRDANERRFDPTVLPWAPEQQRILLTRDVASITAFAYERVRAGKSMPGVVEVGRTVTLRSVIDDTRKLHNCLQHGKAAGGRR